MAAHGVSVFFRNWQVENLVKHGVNLVQGKLRNIDRARAKRAVASNHKIF